MTVIWRLLIVVALETTLLYVAALIVERTIDGAIKAVKVGLKYEFSTGTGRINLAGMILLVFVLVFTELHEMVTSALSVDKPPPAGNSVVVITMLVGFFFVGSVICVLIAEKGGAKRDGH